jgi:hypothetical protein
MSVRLFGSFCVLLIPGNGAAQTEPQAFAGTEVRVVAVATEDYVLGPASEKVKANSGHKWLTVNLHRLCPNEGADAPLEMPNKDVSLVDDAGQAHPVTDVEAKDGELFLVPSPSTYSGACADGLARCGDWKEFSLKFHIPSKRRPAKLQLGDAHILLTDKKVFYGDFSKVWKHMAKVCFGTPPR